MALFFSARARTGKRSRFPSMKNLDVRYAELQAMGYMADLLAQGPTVSSATGVPRGSSEQKSCCRSHRHQPGRNKPPQNPSVGVPLGLKNILLKFRFSRSESNTSTAAFEAFPC